MFVEIFPVKVRGWEYGAYVRCDVKFSFVPSRIGNSSHWNEDSYEEMSGWRLATFIWNNYGTQIYKGKYYGKLVDTDKFGNKIEKSKMHPAGQRHVRRFSKVFLSASDCPFTGFTADNYLLDPLLEFMKAPDDTTFPELMEKCLQSWAKGCGEDMEANTSLEAFMEDAEANDMEFYEDGKQYYN